jgi:hypothetical protein
MGVGLEINGAQFTTQRGTSFFIMAAWVVCFFCQLGKRADVLHIRVGPSSRCHVIEPFVSHRVLFVFFVYV